MKKYIYYLLIIIFLGLVSMPSAQAQCPMCGTTVKSAMQQKGNTRGLGLNDGILYLLAFPYVLSLGLGVFWYQNNKKNRKQRLQEA